MEVLKVQWNQQFCRRCDYCQPCSEGINIQFALGLKSTVKRFGPMAQELKWITDLTGKARNCSECGDCLTRCPYQLPIPELIKKNLAWYDDLKSQS